MTAPAIVARRIGREQQAIAIVDGLAPDPDALRAAARASGFGPARRHYPGLRAPLPPDYLPAVQPILAMVLREVFGIARADLLDASFSIVATPPEALSVQQRLPHVDAVAPGRIALVHYLVPESGDGTAFFRHRATGFETIDETRAPAYFERLGAELHLHGTAPAYVADSTPLFERIALVEGRYNRALLYRSAMLHSGAIGPDTVLTDDPARGRLTVTAFLSAV
jgi:hypothetical protein